MLATQTALRARSKEIRAAPFASNRFDGLPLRQNALFDPVHER
jgi:hypothetical protein